MQDERVVFTINDVDLLIAPEAMAIQQEDLVYTFKTLRTKAATKIPSGHGQSLLQVKIPFMDSDILALHRLIIEFQHSPFCFIENLFVRKSFCPEWPEEQKMAFTLLSADLVPYPGTTDAFILNLEMSWFNYIPYVHNWLYRSDWTTDWMSSPSGKGEPYQIKLSIGWNIDDNGEKSGPRVNVVEERHSTEQVHQEWSALNESYQNKSLTIEDMELLHRGGVFDLLPMPAMMLPADTCDEPGRSLIYKRYINFLQRDALKRNFNIDLEKLIGYKPDVVTFWDQLLFKKFVLDERTGEKAATSEYVHALHIALLPEPLRFTNLQAEWKAIRDTLVEQMLIHKQGAEFHFAAYKSVQLPNAAAKVTAAILKKAQETVAPVKSTVVDNRSPWIYADDNSQKLRVRRGLSEPKGFSSPIGWLSDPKRKFSSLANAEDGLMRWRTKQELERIYGRPFSEGRYHYGSDIKTGITNGVTPVYAMKAGRVTYASTAQEASRSNKWKIIELVDGAWKKTSGIPEIGTELYDDWVYTVTEGIGGLHLAAETGTVLRSLANPDRYFYVDYGDEGLNVTISHNEGREISKYLHLSELLVTRDAQVTSGQIIGYAGNTSEIKIQDIADTFKTLSPDINDVSIPIDLEDLEYTVGTHLHIEYYERKDFYPTREAVSNDEVKIKETRMSGYTIVDLQPTFDWAAQQGYETYISDNPEAQIVTLEVAKEAINDSIMSEEDKSALVQALDLMYQQGYFYYDRQSDITNVWWRPFRISIQTVNPEYPEYGDIIQTDTAVLTNITAGLRHIVANIPILGHEFPTQQHLGSVEPYYNMEFHLLDDTGTLEGLGGKGGILSGLKFLLQHNARKFRPIPDAWCLSAATFFTRLFGSFRESDIQVAVNNESVISDFILTRRTMISRVQQDTVQGNPGLSRFIWELQETNPFTQEALTSEAPALVAVEDARSQVLNKLYKLDFIDEYKDLAIKILIAQNAGANTSLPGEDNFGKFSISQAKVIGDLEALSGNKNVAYMDMYSSYALSQAWNDLQSSYDTAGKVINTDKTYVIRDDGKSLYNALTALGIPVVSFNGSMVNDGNTYLAISEQEVQLDSNIVSSDNKSSLYDIRSILTVSQESLLLGEIPIGKIQNLAWILKQICVSAEMYISEETGLLESGTIDGSPLSKSQVVEELYKLPIEPRLWRTYQRYMVKTGAYCYYPNLINLGIGVSPDLVSGSALNRLDNENKVQELLNRNDNWLVFKEDQRLDDALLFGSISWQDKGWLALDLSIVGGVISDAADRIWHTLKQIGASVKQGDQAFESYWAATYKAANDSINYNLANQYVGLLPLFNLALSEDVKQFIDDSTLGSLFTSLNGDTGLPSIENTKSELIKTISSSGHFAPHPWSYKVPFFLETLTDRTPVTTEVDGAIATALDNFQLGIGSAINDFYFSDKEWLARAKVIFPGNRFTWNVDKQVELEKIRYFKSLMARLADVLLSDPAILRAFDSENLAQGNRSGLIKGREAYPDLDLPHHPYYGTTYAVSPDFYMWNYYEDSSAIDNVVRQEISRGMKTIVQNCYNSMTRLVEGETGANAYRPSRDSAILDPSIDDTIALNIKFNAEGKDGMAVPYYPTDETKSAITDFFANAASKKQGSKTTAEGVKGGGEADNSETQIDQETIDGLAAMKPPGVRTENGTGYYGQGTGVQYPSRLSKDQYEELQTKVNTVTSMFGSRAGYLGQKELPDDVTDRLNGTPLSRDKQPSHKFDELAIQQLAENSSYDLFSQRRRMAAAYPTFKLYFIEEDEFETRLLNYDDFYSYGAVKDFTVTMSRKYAGDTAIISLQNIAGVLDGTKRDAIADLDYFSTKMKASIGDNPVVAGTTSDQPFGSLVLRPGLNVQLRVGYSNDPDLLQVLINGRVVDVQWSQTGDLAEIMVQSFGTELSQILKGTDDSTSDVFYTTHQLLGAMLLEPELTHFGRWEMGKLFQVGEAQDYRMDITDYSKEAHMGRFEHSSAALKWMLSNPATMYAIALGGIGVISALPGAGRLFGGVSRWAAGITSVGAKGGLLTSAMRAGTKGTSPFIQKALTALGVVGTQGAVAFEKQLVVAASTRTARTVVTSDIVEEAALKQVFESSVSTLSTRAAAIMKRSAGDNAPALIKEMDELIALEYIKLSNTGSTIAQAAESIASIEAKVATKVLKGGWMTNPTTMFSSPWEIVKDIGPRAFTNVLEGSFGNFSKLLAGGVLGGLAVDAAVATGIPNSVYQATIGRIQKYFSAAQVSLMLSPQDDNIFAPHPKDYMTLEKTRWASLKQWLAGTVVGIATQSEYLSDMANHYFSDENPYDKRSPVSAYRYKVNNSYIWDILHEMAIRHPGWIYAIRPYGKQFRYTLFFGVPSQRYWAVDADNSFITRVNKITSMLKGDVNVDEYRSLYGDSIEGESLTDFDLGLTLLAKGNTSLQTFTETKAVYETEATGRVYVETATIKGVGGPSASTLKMEVSPGSTAAENQENYYNDKLSALRQVYATRAMKEYLKALDLRFIPFRRYHSISSESNLVLNNIMGSENAMYNAVDVSYGSNDPDEDSLGPVASTLIKAHAFIPENRLRVKPMQPYSNCRGYEMAARYGMGELAFTLRDMYRGEIVVLGNARIMPWDICILQDTYNSMVGPIEVEQVVHQFSHETGFITEIKPSAVVLTNEISSWPVLEAMKLACLAVRSIENDALGLSADSLGTANTVANWLINNAPGAGNKDYEDLATRKMVEIFGDNWSDGVTSMYQKDINPKAVKEITETLDTVADGVSFALNAGAVIGGLGCLALGAAAYRTRMLFGTNMTLLQKGGNIVDFVAAGGGLLTSGIVLGADALIDPPQLMSLLGGNLLLLQCLRGDSMMVIPLMKNGFPISAGLNYHDPTLVWKNFLGGIGRYADDVIGGTRELADLWSIYGMYAWKRISTDITSENGLLTNVDMVGTL